MEFARKQLEKYGWTDGKGLGKNENGISDALKPKIKRSVTGVGHNAAEDFTEHWWTTLYNKAANNVEIEQEKGKTKKIKTNDDDFEITNSTWKLQRKSKDQKEKGAYKSFFVKTAVLANGGSKVEKLRESDSEEEPEKKDVFKMTDEELFAACGGRTAHKGARFGLKATGKLARIKQQEEKLLILDKYNEYSHAKKHKLTESFQETEVEQKCNNTGLKNIDEEENIREVKIKKRKKDKKNQRNRSVQNNSEQDLSNLNVLLPDENECNIKHENLPRIKRKKTKNIDSTSEPIVESTNLEDVDIKIKKKTKKTFRQKSKE